MILYPDGRVEGTPDELAAYARACGRLAATPTPASPLPPTITHVPVPPYLTVTDPPPPPWHSPVWCGVVPPPGKWMPHVTC